MGGGIVAEGFSSLLRWVHHRLITPFFADDNLLFCNATLREVNELEMIFQVYENAPNQSINFTKSAVCFSPSTSVEAKQQIQQLLDVPIVPSHERYLGLPMVAGKDKKMMFRTLKDQIWKKINGWEGK
ncbi:hypothetical protein EV1_022846 [Malus domestica]